MNKIAIYLVRKGLQRTIGVQAGVEKHGRGFLAWQLEQVLRKSVQ